MGLRHVVFVCAVIIAQVSAYKHVIFMHGLFGEPTEFDDLNRFIQKDHPGTNVTVIDAYWGVSSLTSLWTQANEVASQVRQVMKENPGGSQLLCYSQGGITCRAVIELLGDNHTIENFISLSAPQAGQYGDTSYLHYLFPKYLKEELYRIFYTERGQDISIGNYWNDPHHQDLYFKKCNFLPVINNQKPHNDSQAYKAGFSKLKNLVLIGGPDDGVITPWQSSQFGAYDSNETVIDMKQQPWYTEDLFGLKTLDKRGGIHMYTKAGIEHAQWHTNYTIWQCCIEPWLT